MTDREMAEKIARDLVDRYCVHDEVSDTMVTRIESVLRENREGFWIKTAARQPTKEDGDQSGRVLFVSRSLIDFCPWNAGGFTIEPIFPLWARIPEPPKLPVPRTFEEYWNHLARTGNATIHKQMAHHAWQACEAALKEKDTP